MAPANYSLGDYVMWSDADVLSSQQAAWARTKIYPSISFTWGSLYSAAHGNTSSFGSGSRLSQVGWEGGCGLASCLLDALAHHVDSGLEWASPPRYLPSPASQTPTLPGGPNLQGWLCLSRQGGQVLAQLQVGNSAPVAVASSLPAVSGPMLLGLQMLYGFNYSVTLSNISITYGTEVDRTWPPPPPSPAQHV